MNSKKRLLAIISLIEKNKKVIDIGTDHGLVPLYLAKNNISKDILATDISESSLNKLVKSLDPRTSKYIKTMVTDGFCGIEKKQGQVAIIAGMGANTIIDIIEKNMDFSKNLDYMILASNVGNERLREFLLKNSFEICDDFLVYENKKYYDIIKAKYGEKENYDLSETYFGKDNIDKHSKLLEKKLAVEYDKNKKFLKDIKEKSDDKKALHKIELRLEAISEVYDKWK
ncbi:MAG: class I SAM-dependent methyltransferase [Peptoniphilaceae bacterium]|nr:class I SAM-dependent methyltransferase [Peptoniphilaceae bacterium]MDY6019131.1 class I SAM-dependent methyltransferase [Anaerococcus sp.]